MHMPVVLLNYSHNVILQLIIKTVSAVDSCVNVPIHQCLCEMATFKKLLLI